MVQQNFLAECRIRSESFVDGVKTAGGSGLFLVGLPLFACPIQIAACRLMTG
jgi:hypothetical protein